MKSRAIDNPHFAGADELTLKTGSNDKQFGYGAKAALAYGAWAVGDALFNTEIYGLDYEPIPEAIFRTLLIGLPAAPMLFCKGWKAYVPAGFLAVLGLMNGFGHFIGAAMGDPTAGYSYGIAHLFFAAAFARTSWHIFK